MKLLMAIITVLMLTGCTRLHIPNVGTYSYLLSNKSLEIEFYKNGQPKAVRFNTQTDPAVEALANIAASKTP